MRLWFDHLREGDEDFQDKLDSAIDTAVETGQIALHEQTKQTGADQSNSFTRCRVLGDNGDVLAEGFSFCRDQFRKDRGRAFARRRAFALLRAKGIKFESNVGQP